MLALGMLGILVVVHLGIQQNRGFDQGCVGFLAPASVEAAFDCAAVLQSGAGTFLGISNTVWGILFYLAIAGLSAVILLTRGSSRAWARRARPAVLAAGLAYSAYLVYYQFFDLRQLCALCLTSAGIVLLLSIIQGAALVRSRQGTAAASARRPEPATALMKEFRFVGVLAVALVVLVGADVAYFDRIEPVRASSSSEAIASPRTASAESQPQPQSQCGFDDSKPTVANYEEYLGVQDPFVGNPDASVTVMEFFDPNCPHCKTMHAVMKDVIEEYGDQARFFYKPVPLWQYSVNQIEALYAAAQENKFEEMLVKQFERQKQGGLNVRELREIASEIGMDPDQLQQRIDRGIYRDVVMQQRVIASNIGLSGVPTILVNGRFVASPSKTKECLGQIIEDAAV